MSQIHVNDVFNVLWNKCAMIKLSIASYIYTAHLRYHQTVYPLDTVFPGYYCCRGGGIHLLELYPYNCLLLGYRLGQVILSFHCCDLF